MRKFRESRERHAARAVRAQVAQRLVTEPIAGASGIEASLQTGTPRNRGARRRGAERSSPVPSPCPGKRTQAERERSRLAGIDKIGKPNVDQSAANLSTKRSSNRLANHLEQLRRRIRLSENVQHVRSTGDRIFDLRSPTMRHNDRNAGALLAQSF